MPGGFQGTGLQKREVDALGGLSNFGSIGRPLRSPLTGDVPFGTIFRHPFQTPPTQPPPPGEQTSFSGQPTLPTLPAPTGGGGSAQRGASGGGGAGGATPPSPTFDFSMKGVPFGGQQGFTTPTNFPGPDTPGGGGGFPRPQTIDFPMRFDRTPPVFDLSHLLSSQRGLGGGGAAQILASFLSGINPQLLQGLFRR